MRPSRAFRGRTTIRTVYRWSVGAPAPLQLRQGLRCAGGPTHETEDQRVKQRKHTKDLTHPYIAETATAGPLSERLHGRFLHSEAKVKRESPPTASAECQDAAPSLSVSGTAGECKISPPRAREPLLQPGRKENGCAKIRTWDLSLIRAAL